MGRVCAASRSRGIGDALGLRSRQWQGMRRLALVGLAVGLLLPAASQAAFFTLEAAVPISMSDVEGSVRPVESAVGSIALFDGVPLNIVTQDVFVVDVKIVALSASVGSLEIAVSPGTFLNPIGTGAFDDLFPLIAPTSVTNSPLDPVFLTGGFGTFDFLPGQLNAGETTVRLYVSYDLGVISTGDHANFMISSGSDFSVMQGIVMPEPTTSVLFGLSLAGLAVVTRRLGKNSPQV